MRVVLKENSENKKKLKALKMRERRANWTEEEIMKNREQSRIRMARSRERKKTEEKDNTKDLPNTRQNQEKERERLERLRLIRQRYREKLSAQKKRRIREKDRERKRQKRAEKKKEKLQSKDTEANVEEDKIEASVNEEIVNVLKEVTDDLKLDKSGKAKSQRRTIISAIAKRMKERRGLTAKFVKVMSIKRRYIRNCQKERKKRKDAISEETIKRIHEFFKEERHSISVPNMRLIKHDLNTYILQKGLEELYKLFIIENPGIKISFSKFSKLKPKNVKTQNHQKLVQCLCEVCENVTLKLKALNQLLLKHNKNIVKDKYQLVNLTLCERHNNFHELKCIKRECDECGIESLQKILEDIPVEDVTWNKWSLEQCTNPKNNKVIKKRQKISCQGTSHRLIEEMINECKGLAEHLFTAEWQQRQFKVLNETFPERTIVVTVDFAENFSCFSQQEVQGAHWAKDQVTVHPCIVNYWCPSCENSHRVEECVDIISDDLLHDSAAVYEFLKQTFKHIQSQGVCIDRAIVLSDGCGAQYKSKSTFLDCSKAVIDYGFTMERNYYGSRHGKNRCDGEGGVIKQHVKRAITNSAVEINCAEDVYKYLKNSKEIPTKATDSSCNEKRRTILWVPQTSIDHERAKKQPVKTVPGTRQIHSIIGITPGHIRTRKLSCFCDSCLLQSYGTCKHSEYVDDWNDVTLHSVNGELIQPEIMMEDDLSDLQLNSSVLEALSVEEDNEMIVESFISERVRYSEGQFVLVRLTVGSKNSGRHKEYAAEIKEVLPNGDLCLQYMEEVSTGIYKWPIITDVSLESTDSIIKLLPLPTLETDLSTTRCQFYSFI